LTSRLLVPAPRVEPAPVEPVVEKPIAAVKPPAPAPPPEPVLAPAPPPAPAQPKTEATPEPQVAVQKEPEPAPSAAAPSQTTEAPAPSTLIQELAQKTEPAPEAPVEAPAQQAVASEPAAPVEPPAAAPTAPAVAPAAPPPEPEAPTASVAETEPPPPPAESLTSEPAVEAQTAALPPAGALDDQVRVLFQDGSAELNDDAKGLLNAVATALEANPALRIQLLAYAKATTDSTSRARRLSLSRALAVRAFLIERGVRSTRMDVRALGDKIGDGPSDRVDILPQAVN